MRKIFLMLLVVSFAFGLAVAQTRVAVKEVKVTSSLVTKQPKGKAYSVDLTRRDTFYVVAADADRSRIQVRTSKGNMSLASLLQKSNRTMTGTMRIGATSVIRTHLPTIATNPGTMHFNCEGLLCTCSGDADCNDMFTNGGCGDIAACDERGCWCLTL
jgi:hypothetical protein